MDWEPLKDLSSTSQITRRPGSGKLENVFVLLDSRLTKINVSVYLMGSQVTNLPPPLPPDGSRASKHHQVGGWKACPGVSSLFSFYCPKLIRVCRWRPPACLSSGRLSGCRYVIFYISASAVKFTVIKQVSVVAEWKKKSHEWPLKAAGCRLGSFRSGWNVGFDSLKTSLKCDVLEPVRKSGQVWVTPSTTAVQSDLTLDPPGALGQPNKTDLFELKYMGSTLMGSGVSWWSPGAGASIMTVRLRRPILLPAHFPSSLDCRLWGQKFPLPRMIKGE